MPFSRREMNRRKSLRSISRREMTVGKSLVVVSRREMRCRKSLRTVSRREMTVGKSLAVIARRTMTGRKILSSFGGDDRTLIFRYRPGIGQVPEIITDRKNHWSLANRGPLGVPNLPADADRLILCCPAFYSLYSAAQIKLAAFAKYNILVKPWVSVRKCL
jgi:hypothetical protein